MYGRNLFHIIDKRNIKIDGFIETNPEKKSAFGLPVYSVDEVINEQCGMILGLNRLNSGYVERILIERKYNMDNVIYGYKYIDNGGERGGYNDKEPTIEITTKIGCSVNCRYCPQSKLINEYSRLDNAEYMMSLDTFTTCLDKIPQNCRILFCGMAEPLLNPECIKMMRIALNSQRKVDLYTTLVGIDSYQLEELLELPFSFVTLHVADKYGYAKIKTDENYYAMIRRAINKKKEDGTPFVNICNSQAEPDEIINKICEGKYNVIYELHDRAGNLSDDKLISASKLRKGKISCSLCGQALNHNILLPDGRVLLCCMDYGMQHVLGNLKEQSYEDIMNGEEMKLIKRAINGEESVDVLCRYCSSATEIK